MARERRVHGEENGIGSRIHASRDDHQSFLLHEKAAEIEIGLGRNDEGAEHRLEDGNQLLHLLPADQIHARVQVENQDFVAIPRQLHPLPDYLQNRSQQQLVLWGDAKPRSPPAGIPLNEGRQPIVSVSYLKLSHLRTFSIKWKR